MPFLTYVKPLGNNNEKKQIFRIYFKEIKIDKIDPINWGKGGYDYYYLQQSKVLDTDFVQP